MNTAADALSSRLSERVSIEQPVATPDELGGQSISWVLVAECWAEIVPTFGSARESIIDAQVHAVAGYRVRIRKRGDIDARMRVVWRGHVLPIHALHEHGELQELLAYEEGL